MPKRAISPHVLLVEDTPFIHQSLHRALQRHFTVDATATLNGACQYIAQRQEPYDAIVLDRILPDGDGLEVLRMLQADKDDTRVCVITEQKSTSAQAAALRQNVDTYLLKPLTPSLVVAHVYALLRRGKILTDSTIRWFDLSYLPKERLVKRRQQTTHLSQRENQFMSIFCRTPAGQATHEQLRTLLWHQGESTQTSVIHVTIQRLRRRLRPLDVYIDGLYGLGYQLRLGNGDPT